MIKMISRVIWIVKEYLSKKFENIPDNKCYFWTYTYLKYKNVWRIIENNFKVVAMYEEERWN